MAAAIGSASDGSSGALWSTTMASITPGRMTLARNAQGGDNNRVQFTTRGNDHHDPLELLARERHFVYSAKYQPSTGVILRYSLVTQLIENIVEASPGIEPGCADLQADVSPVISVIFQ